MKKTGYKKGVMIISGVLFIIALGFTAKLYMIGEPVAGEQVYCTTSVNGHNLKLQVETVESGVAFRGWKYKRDGSALYISARKVLVSPLFDDGYYETSINIELIEKVLFGNKVIWSGKGQQETTERL